MSLRRLLPCLLLLAGTARGSDDAIDRLDEALTFGNQRGDISGRFSGTFDLEGYQFQHPVPGLIYTPKDSLITPRLTTFLDLQLGPRVYFFAQARVDTGFDPSDDDVQARLDEYALRLAVLDDARLSVQLGKFASVVGSWARRHGSWENPFITAPLVYENLTGLWDVAAARSGSQLLGWGHITPPLNGNEYADKQMRIPVIWGPSYATGAAVFGELGKFTYAAEIKNAALSSPPDDWTVDKTNFQNPSYHVRLGYKPNMMWDLGLSGATGTYLQASAAPTIPAGYSLGDYRQTVIGQDVSFAWHYWQCWFEAYEARFAIPKVGNADTFSYYTEVRYKFTPQLAGALRWNQQTFGTLPAGGELREWGRDIWRVDVGPAYRFTPHLQLKLQYSLQHEDGAARTYNHIVSEQITLRF